MKKFKYAIGIAAMALFGACSSDAPEIVNNQDQLQEGESADMYVKIQLADGSTRAAGTDGGEVQGNDALHENDIQDVRLVVIDWDNVKQIDAFAESIDDDLAAYFKIPSTAFNSLSSKPDSECEILVWANPKATSGKTETAIKAMSMRNDATSTITWPHSVTKDGSTVNYDAFQFSNSAKVKGTLNPVNDNDGSSKEKAWELHAAIPLDRLASRFDLGTMKSEYPLNYNSGIKLTNVQIAVNTLSTSTFILPQYSSNGSQSGMEYLGNSVEGQEGWYAVSPEVSGNVELDELYKHFGEGKQVLSATVPFYARPRCLPYGENGTAEADYSSAAYAAIKAEFTFPTDMKVIPEGSTDTKLDAVYTYNGVLLGNIEKIKSYKTNAFTLTAPAGASQTMKDKLEQVQKDVRAYVATLGNEDYSTIDDQLTYTGSSDALCILKCEKYTPAADGKYYTYYNRLISHSNSEKDLRKKHNILRNHIYNISVESFNYLGANGTDVPQDFEDEHVTQVYVNLSVIVNKWTLNKQNENWKF